MSSPIVLTVSELTFAIKSQLEPLFRHIWVRGEVSNLKQQSSGHIYFSLKEGGCQLSAVLFRSQARALSHPLKDGDTVVAQGEINIYPPRGAYQLIVREISHVGLGEALLKLQALKKKLQQLGWFKKERKRALPSPIKRIGLVTSPTGAVLHDIVNVLSRRIGGFHLIVNPVRVQGDGAAQEIARAIEQFNELNIVDIIVVCRGGGSAEDLSAFNEEIVATACVKSSIPIISAVGHETDLTITDLVADLRAPTPSAAAELISHEKFQQREKLFLFLDNAKRLLFSRLSNCKEGLFLFSKRLSHAHPKRKVETFFQQLDDIETSFQSALYRLFHLRKNLLSQVTKRVQQFAPTAKLAKQTSQLIFYEKALREYGLRLIHHQNTTLSYHKERLDERLLTRFSSCKQRMREKNWKERTYTRICAITRNLKSHVEALSSHMKTLHPQRTLERGYAIVCRENSHDVVRSIENVASGDCVQIRVADGTMHGTINRKNTEKLL
jgi:exodeoxyribonuclease VII large subunit